MKRYNFSFSMPKGFSKGIHTSVLTLTLFGVLMIVSSSANIKSGGSAALLFVAVKEFGFIFLSYYLMVFTAKNYSHLRLKKFYNIMLMGIWIALLGTQFFRGVHGDVKAWLRFPGGITIQPSEFAKVAVILITVHSLGDKKNSKHDFWDLVTHPLLIVGLMCFYVLVFQKDLGTAAIMALIFLFTLIIPANVRLRKFQALLILTFISFIVLLWASTTTGGITLVQSLPLPDKIKYMASRFSYSANPFLDPTQSSQIFNGLAAFVSGGLFGVGIGKGFLKYSFIFAADSDSILAIIVEELGVVFGFGPIVFFYGVIIYQLMRYTFKVSSEKDKIILVGTIAYVFIHFLFNVGGVSAIIPMTGVPLLLISAGGSSRMAFMIAIGLAQNVIARYNTRRLD